MKNTKVFAILGLSVLVLSTASTFAYQQGGFQNLKMNQETKAQIMEAFENGDYDLFVELHGEETPRMTQEQFEQKAEAIQNGEFEHGMKNKRGAMGAQIDDETKAQIMEAFENGDYDLFVELHGEETPRMTQEQFEQKAEAIQNGEFEHGMRNKKGCMRGANQ